MSQSRKKPDKCDCQLGKFDCVEKVRRWMAGDETAGDELIKKFSPIVDSIVRRKLGSERRDDWENCSQVIWLRLIDTDRGKQKSRGGTAVDQPAGASRLHEWLQREDRGPFCWWLYAVAARRAIDWVRPRCDKWVALEKLLPTIADTGRPPIDDLIRAEERARVKKSVAQFPPEWRLIYKGRYKQSPELPWKDILAQINHLRQESGNEQISERTMFNWNSEILARLKPCFQSRSDW